MTEYPYILFNKSPEQLPNWAPAAAGPPPATSAPAAPSSRHRRKLCRLPRCHSKPPPKPSTCWMLSSPGCKVRKENAPAIECGSPRPLRALIKTSDARGDRTRTAAWIPAMTARGAGGEVRLPAARLRAFGEESIRGAPASSPRHPGYLRSPGKKPRTPRRFPKPNGIVGSPVRSSGGC